MHCNRCLVLDNIDRSGHHRGADGFDYCRVCFTFVVSPSERARARLSAEKVEAIVCRLRWLKSRSNIRLREIREVLGVSGGTAGSYFSRKAPKLPPAAKLIGLCEMFGVTPDQVLGYRHLDAPPGIYDDYAPSEPSMVSSRDEHPDF